MPPLTLLLTPRPWSLIRLQLRMVISRDTTGFGRHLHLRPSASDCFVGRHPGSHATQGPRVAKGHSASCPHMMTRWSRFSRNAGVHPTKMTTIRSGRIRCPDGTVRCPLLQSASVQMRLSLWRLHTATQRCCRTAPRRLLWRLSARQSWNRVSLSECQPLPRQER